MKITKFFNEDYIGYAGYDVSRKIPNLVDGFKISQRKVYHTLNFHKINSASKEIKINLVEERRPFTITSSAPEENNVIMLLLPVRIEG